MLAVVPEEHPRLSLCHRLVAATLRCRVCVMPMQQSHHVSRRVEEPHRHRARRALAIDIGR